MTPCQEFGGVLTISQAWDGSSAIFSERSHIKLSRLSRRVNIPGQRPVPDFLDKKNHERKQFLKIPEFCLIISDLNFMSSGSYENRQSLRSLAIEKSFKDVRINFDYRITILNVWKFFCHNESIVVSLQNFFFWNLQYTSVYRNILHFDFSYFQFGDMFWRIQSV